MLERTAGCLALALVIAVEWNRLDSGGGALFHAFFVAFCFVLVTWACATLGFLGAFAISSVDDFGDLLRASLSSAVPAMWFSPALLLILNPGYLHRAVACVLAANAVRLLMSQQTPHDLGSPTMQKPLSRHETPPTVLPVSGIAVPQPGFSAIAGALLVQLALFAMLVHYSLPGLVCLGFGVAIWTWDGISSGASELKKIAPAPLFMFDSAVTLLLAGLLSATQLTNPMFDVRNLDFLAMLQGSARRFAVLHDPEVRPTKKPAGSKDGPSRAAVMPIVGGVPGVILRPVKATRQSAASVSPPGVHFTFMRPLSFPFTGEYYLFPSSNGQISKNAEVQRGTPLELLYQSVSGGTVQTEAYQKLEPSVELRGLKAIEVVLASGEISPASASMQVIVDSGGVEDLGMEVFGLEPAKQVKLTFAVPPEEAGIRARAIQIVFERNPAVRYQTARVAIRQFTLIPK
jgi:hypothetical protein